MDRDPSHFLGAFHGHVDTTCGLRPRLLSPGLPRFKLRPTPLPPLWGLRTSAAPDAQGACPGLPSVGREGLTPQVRQGEEANAPSLWDGARGWGTGGAWTAAQQSVLSLAWGARGTEQQQAPERPGRQQRQTHVLQESSPAARGRRPSGLCSLSGAVVAGPGTSVTKSFGSVKQVAQSSLPSVAPAWSAPGQGRPLGLDPRALHRLSQVDGLCSPGSWDPRGLFPQTGAEPAVLGYVSPGPGVKAWSPRGAAAGRCWSLQEAGLVGRL